MSGSADKVHVAAAFKVPQRHTASILSDETLANQLLEEGQKMLQGSVYPNMDELPEMQVAAVLGNVANLYSKEQCRRPGEKTYNKIYSQVGPVLIAMNPFEKLPCMGHTWAERFRQEGRAGTIANAWQSVGPHCYGTMEQVYQGLARHPKQSVVICGESGAGKTYTNKLMMQYLLQTEEGGRSLLRPIGSTRTVRNSIMEARASGTPAERPQHSIDMEMLAAGNELLEAFGNAKTARNDNSSRFSKYTKLCLAGKPLNVKGLQIDNYLLEQARTVDVPCGERNYHIFHYLACRERKENGKGPEYFKVTSSAKDVLKADGTPFDDSADFENLQDKMYEAGFLVEEIEHILKYIRAIMFLGNVEFEEGRLPDSSVVGSTTMSDFTTCCSLLGLDPDKFGSALTSAYMKTATEGIIRRDVEVRAADGLRRSVMKRLYARIFDWIIRITNARLSIEEFNVVAHPVTIALLDIFGFEDMPSNEFIQLFINLANEHMQHLFNDIMIEREMAVYGDEAISFNHTPPPNNKLCLDLFGAPAPNLGIIGWIAERVKEAGNNLDKSDGESFVQQRLNPKFRAHPNYVECTPQIVKIVEAEKQRKWHSVAREKLFYKECFQIKHYAGVVTYTVKQFLEKSRDTMEEHLIEVFKQSTERDLQELFRPEPAGNSRLTIGEKFLIQLKHLVEELRSSNTVFIRCIKPTPLQKPGILNPTLVLEQLNNGGVVSALEMRRAGLPDRLSFADFMTEFWLLETGEYRELRTKISPESRCAEVLTRIVGPSEINEANGRITTQWKMGNTKVFMQSGVMTLLRACRNYKMKMGVLKVQQVYKAKRGRKLQDLMARYGAVLKEQRQRADASGIDKLSEAQLALDDAGRLFFEMSSKMSALQKRAQEERAKDPNNRDDRWAAIFMMNEVLKSRDMKFRDLEKSVKRAQALLEKTFGTRDAVEARVDDLLAMKKREVTEWLDKVDACRQLCLEHENILAQAVLAECDAVSNRIEATLSQELPRLRKKMVDDHTESSIPIERIELSPEIVAILKRAEEQYNKVAKATDELVEARRRYERELREADPEFQQRMADRRAMLDSLQQLRATAEEFPEVVELIHEAMEHDVVIDEHRRLGASVEVYLASVETFMEAARRVHAAMAEAEGMKAEEAKRMQEKYRQALEALKNGHELERAAIHFQQTLAKARAELERSDSLCSEDSDQREKLQEMLMQQSMAPVLNDLRAKLGFAMRASMDLDFRQAFLQEVDGQEMKLVPEGAAVIPEGEWSIECSERLGPEIPPRCKERRVPVLDKDKYTSRVAAIQALNTGDMTVEEGFCIGWSATQQGYYLLFQPRRQAEAFAALGGAPSNFFKEQRFADAVRKVCDTNNLKEMAALARNMDEQRTEELRAALQVQIDELEQRLTQAQREANAAKHSELAHIQAASNFQHELKEARLLAKSAQGDARKASTVSTQKEVFAGQRETQLRVALEEAHSIIASQQLQIRQLQLRASTAKGLDTLLSNAFGGRLGGSGAHAGLIAGNAMSCNGLTSHPLRASARAYLEDEERFWSFETMEYVCGALREQVVLCCGGSSGKNVRPGFGIPAAPASSIGFSSIPRV